MTAMPPDPGRNRPMPSDPVPGPEPSPEPQAAAYLPPATYTPAPYEPPAAYPLQQLPPGAGFIPPAPARRRRWWVAALVVALAAAGFVGYRAVHRSRGHAYPSAWDPRVLPSVRFVEKARGLSFKHPIKVEFLADAAFRKQVTSDPTKVTAAEKKGLADSAAELRAVGLVSGNLDLGAAIDQLQGDSVVGFYNFRTKSIAVRGQTLSLADKVTLVHELTHALQDQYFDISTYAAGLGSDESGAADGFRAVTEGDAVRVENDFVRSLTPAQKRQESKEQAAAEALARQGAHGLPQILAVLQEQPYTLGRAMVDFQLQARGETGVDDLFKTWPTSDMQVFQPWRYVAGDVPVPVSRPALRAGEVRFDSGSFGADEWYFMLAQQLGPRAALRATDGWAGDAFVAYRTRTRTCLRVDYRADSAGHLQTMRAALSAWVKAVPATRASVRPSGRGLRFESCDPGTAHPATVAPRSGAALGFAVDRVDLATGFMRGGIDLAVAGCAATKVMDELPVAQIIAKHPTARTHNLVVRAVRSCT